MVNDDTSDVTRKFTTDSAVTNEYTQRDVVSTGEGVYESQDGSDSADNVDPRLLHKDATLTELRWYYRNDAFGSTIVSKPVHDAFKHGFTVNDDEKQRFLERFVESYRDALEKARRDGAAYIWARVRDTNQHWESPSNVKELVEFKVITVDDLTDAKPLAFEEKLSAGNADNFDNGAGAGLAQSRFETVDSLKQLAELAEDGVVPTVKHRVETDDGNTDSDGDDELVIDRIPRMDDDSSKINGDAVTTDALQDPGITEEEIQGSLPYGRSRYYETSNGVVYSNRLDDERFEKPIGYLYDRGSAFNPMLIHHDRMFHVTVNDTVDGAVDGDAWGEYEGDSALQPVIHLLRAVKKGNWALGHILYKHATPLHVMGYENGVPDDDITAAESSVTNINAKSSIMEPPGFELRAIDTDHDVPVDDIYSVFVEQLCAGTEFTKSVLIGSQTGSVAGSETDVKNYFNQIERDRETLHKPHMKNAVDWYAAFDASDYSFDSGVTSLDWGPLFKLSRLDRAEAMARHVQLTTQAVSNYLLEPSEARSVLQEQWADWSDAVVDSDAPVSLEELKELNSDNGDNGGDNDGDDGDVGGNPRVGQNGGGRERGDVSDSDTPTTQ